MSKSRLTLIHNLSRRETNVEEIVNSFILEFATSPSDLYVQLGNLICYCCKIPSFPSVIVQTGDLRSIAAFLRELLKSGKMNTTISDLHSSRLWPNVLFFFHHLIRYEWDLLSNDAKFDSFFAKFLSVLSDVNLPVVRYFALAIQLEYISVITRYRSELLRDEQHRSTILEYIGNILLNSFHDYERKVWTHSLLQMRQWFQQSEDLLNYRCLRFLVWTLHDHSTFNIHQSLQISAEVLDRHHDPSLVSFVKALVKSLTDMLVTDDMNLFAGMCDCACVLYEQHTHLSRRFIHSVFACTFATKRVKAKLAAIVYARTALKEQPSKNMRIRAIVQFLMFENSVSVELFVDALIDDECDLLTDWDTVANTLLYQLADSAEREMLLLVILSVAKLLIDRTKPFLRDEKTEITLEDDVTTAMTAAFAPLLDVLTEENTTFRTRLLICKLATYFDFHIVDEARRTNVFTEYINVFTTSETVLDIVQTSVLFKLLITILHRGSEYDKLVDQMKTLFENKFFDMVGEIDQNAAENLVASMNIVIVLFTLRSIVPLDEKHLLQVFVNLLQMDPQTDNALLSLCQEMAVVFCCEYVENLLSKFQGAVNKEESVENVELMKLIFNVFNDCLNDNYESRLGQFTFFAQCRLIRSLFDSNLDESERATIFTPLQGACLTAYVSLVLGNVQSTEFQSPFDSKNFIVENIIDNFLELITNGILKLHCAYELVHAYRPGKRELETHLRKFLRWLLEKHSAEEVGLWIFQFFAMGFTDIKRQWLAELVKRSELLSQLLQSMRVSMTLSMRLSLASATEYFHKLGMDFALRSANEQNSEVRTMEFLLLLTKFTACLSAEKAKSCYEHYRQLHIVGSPELVRLYGNSLRKKGNLRRAVKRVESSESSVATDESTPAYSQSQSSSNDENLDFEMYSEQNE